MSYSKYSAKPTFVDGIRFASKKEAARYEQLILLQRGNVIKNLELQPKFYFTVDGRPVLSKSARYPNGRPLKMVADFKYFDIKTNGTVWEDVKGFRTKEFVLKKAFFECMNPGTVLVEV